MLPQADIVSAGSNDEDFSKDRHSHDVSMHAMADKLLSVKVLVSWCGKIRSSVATPQIGNVVSEAGTKPPLAIAGVELPFVSLCTLVLMYFKFHVAIQRHTLLILSVSIGVSLPIQQ